MAALQPAIYRRKDHFAAYDVMIPLTSSATGEWAFIRFAQPYWDNIDRTLCLSYGALAINDIRVGVPHSMAVATPLYGGLTESGGGWADTVLANHSGYMSGHSGTRTGTSTGSAVTYSVPAGHDSVAVCLYVQTNPKGFTVALAGTTLQTVTSASIDRAYPYLETWTYSFAVSGVARDLVITADNTAASALVPISVTSWSSTTPADPRDVTADIHDGNGFIEQIVNSRYGTSSGAALHAFNQGTQWWRMCKPNTVTPIIKHVHVALNGWTSLEHPHYTATDVPLTITVEPSLIVDGVEVAANMNTLPGGGGMDYGRLYQGDHITIRQTGTAGAGPSTYFYEHHITSDGITCMLRIDWAAADVVSLGYGPTLSGTAVYNDVAETDVNLAQIIHRCRTPNDSTVYPTNANATVESAIVDAEVPGCPYVVRLEGIGGGAYLMLLAGFAKVYVAIDLDHFEAPAIGGHWVIGSRVRFIQKYESFGLSGAGGGGSMYFLRGNR